MTIIRENVLSIEFNVKLKKQTLLQWLMRRFFITLLACFCGANELIR